MDKIAFVFAGQGSQYPGMGRDLYEMSEAAKRIFDEAEKAFPGIKDLCFSGDMEELTKTENTQPSVFTVDIACASALAERGFSPEGAAGFSLGEAAALHFCGTIGFDEAMKMVIRRGEFMKACAGGVMAAVLRLDSETVEKLCAECGTVYPANFNCPGQTVVSGSAEAMEAYSNLVNERGGRAMKLAVSGAFHSPFMEEASVKLREELDKFTIKKPEIPLYSNVTAAPYGENIRDLFASQVKSPVMWQKTVENMISDGYGIFVEVGPGKVLSGLIKKINSNVTVLNVENRESLEKTIAALGGT